jgi:acetolactate synthase I/II/III large subunit
MPDVVDAVCAMLEGMKAAELFVRCLESEGVERIFAVPGEENLDLIEALRESTIDLVVTRHEQSAGFMAAAQGRLTGKPGVCLGTLGPGATNLVTAAAYAELGAMPMVMITGQKPIKTSRQGHFQIVDVVDLMKPVTRYTRQVVSGATVPARVREAFRLAEEERPGATHLELPEDILREKVDAEPIRASQTRRPVAEEKAVARAVEAIEQARRPLLMIGAGANRKLTSRMLARLVARTGIPFFSTQMGKGVVGESDAWLGTAALSDGDFVHRAIEQADCIVNLGHDVVEKPPFLMRKGRRTVIHVNFFSAEVDPVYFPQIEVVGDIANAVWQIDERLKVQPHWDFSFFRKARDVMLEDLDRGRELDGFPVHPRRLVHAVREAMPEDGIVSLDNGLYKVWFARNYRTTQPNTLLLDNALATMGAGLPVAMGARVVHPERKILAVCGDGGFMMNSQELETAVRLNMNLVVLILRDDAYGMIRWKQQDMGLADFGMDFGNPDFVKYAESYGATGHRVASVFDLIETLKKSLNTPGVHLIDCPIDYSDSQSELMQQIPARAAKLTP